MRIPALQIAEWVGREESMLWCFAVHYGERSKGV